MSQWALLEFECPVHGRFESVQARADAPDVLPCPECDVLSPWRISAPHQKVLSVPCSAVVRGGDTERRPGMLDTRPLAEGMSHKEWRAKEAKVTQERRHQQLIKAGLKQRKIQVG